MAEELFDGCARGGIIARNDRKNQAKKKGE
jgi:hypothetical protein